MSTTSKYLFILISFLFVSCDPTYNVEYIITNGSSQDIEIQSRLIFQEDISVAIIASGQSLIIGQDGGIGESTKRYLNDWTSPTIYIEELAITATNGSDCQIDVLNGTNWNIYHELSEIELPLFDRHFE